VNSGKLPANRQSGFTLLEVMVATAILAVGLAAISGAISMAVRSTALSTGYERARQVAENQLALFLLQRPDKARRLQGDEGQISWQLRAEQDPEREGLLQISVEARFFSAGGERSVILQTREMARTIPESKNEGNTRSDNDESP
jgi:prepilin-type N-terminal cleavage/methylation domain-containing protein